jgi:hypothetical protein
MGVPTGYNSGGVGKTLQTVWRGVMPTGDKCWKEWTIDLRQHMIRNKLPEITKSTEEIRTETGTDETLKSLQSQSFWKAVRDQVKDWDTIPRNGLEVTSEPNAVGEVEFVTLWLNDTWKSVVSRRD